MALRVLAGGLLSLIGLGSQGIPGAAAAQKTAFTADGARVFLHSNGTWSTDADQRVSNRLELAVQQERQSASSEDRCTLIFGLHNGFALNLRKVVAEVQFLDTEAQFIQSRRVTFKNPRSGEVRFAEVSLQLPQGCAAYGRFDVADVPTCEAADGTDVETCFDSLLLLHD